MNYNKKLIVTILIIACAHATIQSSYKRTSMTFRVLNPMRPTMQGHMQASHVNPIMQQIRHRTAQARQAMEKMYAPFEHPLYTKFIEPIYVGNKSDTWNKQMREHWNNIMMNTHDKFASKMYYKWRSTLSEEEKIKYFDDMRAYEQSYFAYKKNPDDLEIQQKLLLHTRHMQEIMQHTAPTRQERIRNILFGE